MPSDAVPYAEVGETKGGRRQHIAFHAEMKLVVASCAQVVTASRLGLAGGPFRPVGLAVAHAV